MPVFSTVDDTRNVPEDADGDVLNPVVEASARAWQYLFAPHTQLSAQFLPAVRRSHGEREGRRMAGQKVYQGY